MNRQDIELLIFDMDGVVLDSEPLHKSVRQSILREMGLRSDDRLPNPVGKSSSGFWRRVLEVYQMKGDPYELERRQYGLVARQIEENHLQPSDGFLDVAKRAKARGIKIALASSSTRMLVDDALRLLGVDQYFDITVSGDEVARKKPEPDVYLRALELAGTRPHRAAAVEDSQAGVRAARRAGIFCYGYVNENSGGQDLSEADRVIRHLGEIEV